MRKKRVEFRALHCNLCPRCCYRFFVWNGRNVFDFGVLINENGLLSHLFLIQTTFLVFFWFSLKLISINEYKKHNADLKVYIY